MIINEKNIFEYGMLINLQLGTFQGRVKLSPEQIEEKNLPSSIVRGIHDIFDKNYKKILQEIFTFDNKVRWDVRHRSIPFPINGVYFVASQNIENVVAVIEERQREREELVNNAVAEYDKAIKEFAENYPEYYEHAKSKYLSKKQFAERFYFKYQFIKVSTPTKDSFISPEMYKAEMKKFKETIGDMKQEVLGIIGSTLLEMTARLKSQCADGKPNQRTFNNLNEFLARIDNVYSDFIDRDDLKKTIKKIKAQVLGVDAGSLRDSEDFKKKFGKEIGALAKEINALPDIPLKRAIDF